MRNASFSLLMNWFSCLLSAHWNPNWTKGFPSSFSSFTWSYSWFCLSKFFKLTFLFQMIWVVKNWASLDTGRPASASSERLLWVEDVQGLFSKSLPDKFFYFLRTVIPDGKEPTRFGRSQATKSYFGELDHRDWDYTSEVETVNRTFIIHFTAMESFWRRQEHVVKGSLRVWTDLWAWHLALYLLTQSLGDFSHHPGFQLLLGVTDLPNLYLQSWTSFKFQANPSTFLLHLSA